MKWNVASYKYVRVVVQQSKAGGQESPSEPSGGDKLAVSSASTLPVRTGAGVVNLASWLSCLISFSSDSHFTMYSVEMAVKGHFDYSVPWKAFNACLVEHLLYTLVYVRSTVCVFLYLCRIYVSTYVH